MSLINDISKRIEARKEDCYNCENLTKFNRKELGESIAEWKNAKAKGLLKNLADPNPYIASCRVKGFMTELKVLTLHNNCEEVSIKI